MSALLRISAAIDWLNEQIGKLVGVLVLAMVGFGAFNALARYAGRFTETQLSSNAFIELQWYLFSLVFLLGAPYTLRANGHVRVDVLYGGHRPVARAWIDLVGTLVFLLPFCAVATWYSWDFAAISIREGEISSDPNGLLRWPLKAVIPAAFILVGLQGISEAIKRVGILKGLTPEEVELDETPLEEG